ncbi:MAG: hypothetical protein ABIY55_28940 [Kofleriaceae bacterium]
MHRSLSLPFALLLALPTVACLDRGGGGDSQSVSSALEQPSGGYDTANEAAAFGADDEIASAAIEGDTAAVDAMANDPATTAMDQASGGNGFKVVLLWGKLPADRTATTARDWTGSLKVSRGGLIVRRTIAFEDATDHLLPRAALDTVSFASFTRPYVDGLVLTVLDPGPSTSSAQTLTYTPANNTASYTLDLTQLAAGPIVVDAGDGYKMIAIGHRRQANACDRGFMRGRWHALSPHLGTYLGVVTNEDGDRVGHVRGVFGQRRNGDAVLFGKFIDREGQFRGLLIGSFADGEYHARWIDRQGDHGSAHGAYFEGQAASTGHFLGRWAEASCSADN